MHESIVDPKIAAIKYEHGTRARYALAKCRCEPFSKANRTYAREQYRRRHGPWVIEFTAFELTKTYAAANGGAGVGRYVVRHRKTGEIVLRTTDRAVAFAEQARRNDRDGEKDASQMVSALRARRRLADLAKQNIGQHAIVKQTKIARSTLREISSGRVKRIKRSTQDLILAVVPVVRPGATVPAGPTWKLIDEMLALGKTKTWIAMHLGIGKALQIRKTRVLARTAAKVLRLSKLVKAAEAQRRAAERAAAPPTPQAKLRKALAEWDADEFSVRLSRFRSDDAPAANITR